ncbi:MAG: glutamine--fructose-6-phosphate transaminase (isomerizing) [Verrucomicrobia bacterium]|nr:glutamine--fructose-6-phosphate transaminase (isomerizing) [Verrucomicrobiota bacterium]
MCGIFGYIGPDDAADICLTGLKKLEYRGYDSAGLAGIVDGELLYCKEVGKIRNLEQAWVPKKLDLAIAHTRWATHGAPSKDNAHPHFDQHLHIAVVHNGIIENHHQLREMLKNEGVTFRSDTDSEVIAQLIAHFYEDDFIAAFQRAISLLQGFWAIAAIHKNHDDYIITSARENPLAIGHRPHTQECFISSDPNAFAHTDLDVIFLKNDEIAVVRSDQIEVFDGSFARIEKVVEKLTLENMSQSKEGFEHFMLKEIFEQGQTITKAIHSRFIEEFGTVEFENFAFSPQELQSVKRILILACGTSWHAGSLAALLLEDKARIPTHAEIASEFRYRNPIISEDTLVIAISQSGETLDTIAAVREVKRKGAKVLGICNVRNSTLTREADGVIFLRAGPEISVCSTKAFTSQITVLSLFTLLMGRLRHISAEEGQAFLSEIKRLPQVVEAVLQQKDKIAELAEKYARFEHFFFLGRHYMYVTALEAALKLKEISYLNATAYPAGEMKHGPIALINPDLAVIGLCGSGLTYEKTLSNLSEIKARGGPLLAIAFEGSEEVERVADEVLYIPSICNELATIPYSVACQLLAYFIARIRGTDIDQPRNLAKSVTVE